MANAMWFQGIRFQGNIKNIWQNSKLIFFSTIAAVHIAGWYAISSDGVPTCPRRMSPGHTKQLAYYLQ